MRLEHLRRGQAFLLALALLCLSDGCGVVPRPLLPSEATDTVDAERFELVARFAHITDAQIVDEESPARLTVATDLSRSAWRPQERFAIHLLDGMVRTINKIHAAQHRIDFVVHTGDATDNAQLNELGWFMTAMDGGPIDPRSGPDDREPGSLPEPEMDPHHLFLAQGFYRQGVHGQLSTIDWFNLLGNHDRFAVGVFPIVTDRFGRRSSPLALGNRIGLFLPVVLNPLGVLAWGPITPADPGPPMGLNFPSLVEPNPDRRYLTTDEFIEAHSQGDGTPAGHGLGSGDAVDGAYSVEVAAGLRLIAFNSASPAVEQPTLVYSEGAISVSQLAELKRQLGESQDRGELVVVASHHPSLSLDISIGTAATESSLVALLNRYPCVVLHLSGHLHQSLVIDRGGYLEIVTGSIIDTPQQGRIVEIYRAKEQGNGGVEIRYRFFSHLDTIEPTDGAHSELFDDPFLGMRRLAAELAESHRR